MKKLTTFLGVVGVLAVTPFAHADIQLAYQIGAGSETTCATTASASPNTSTSCSVSAGGISITNFGAFGQQTPSPTQQFSSTVNIQNNSGSQVTVVLWVADQNFTSPTAPPAITWTSNLQFTAVAGSGTITMTSCADTANGLTNPFCSGAGSPTLANSMLTFSGPGTPPPDTVSRSITSLASPYSLGEKITLVLNNGASLNFNASQVLTPVPEPTSIALLGGVLLLTAGAIRRKRNAASREQA